MRCTKGENKPDVGQRMPGAGLSWVDVPGRSRLIRQPSSRTGKNPPYGMIGGSRKRRHHSKPGSRSILPDQMYGPAVRSKKILTSWW
jgi:hypothetical protein